MTVLAALPAAEQARADADRQVREAVQAARGAGATWAEIGAALGVTRQTAWEKFHQDGWS